MVLNITLQMSLLLIPYIMVTQSRQWNYNMYTSNQMPTPQWLPLQINQLKVVLGSNPTLFNFDWSILTLCPSQMWTLPFFLPHPKPTSLNLWFGGGHYKWWLSTLLSTIYYYWTPDKHLNLVNYGYLAKSPYFPLWSWRSPIHGLYLN